tara:strand:+ start:4575 stop:5618 length:1044 start_codon:yes stop_codon:yes gene_type:complete
MEVKDKKPWEQLREYLQQDDSTGLNTYLADLSGAESIRALMRLGTEEQQKVLAIVPPEAAAEVFDFIPDERVAEMLGELSPEIAASIVHEMSSDGQADVLSELDEDDLEEILQFMDQGEAGTARQLMAYDADLAGGLMMTEYFSFPRSFSAGAVLANLAKREDEYDLNHVQYIYITGRSGSLLGVARIRDIIFSRPEVQLRDILRPADFVRDTATLDELEDFFDEHHLTAVPVVDEQDKMLGVVRRQAVYDAVAAQADSDHLKSQGIVGGEELRSMPTLLRSRRRLSWLSVNTLIAVSIGGTVPVFLKRMNIDPAVASGPILTTVTDMCGFFLLLGTASLMLPLLTA